jgi:acyl-CoA-binding protein
MVSGEEMVAKLEHDTKRLQQLLTRYIDNVRERHQRHRTHQSASTSSSSHHGGHGRHVSGSHAHTLSSINADDISTNNNSGGGMNISDMNDEQLLSSMLMKESTSTDNDNDNDNGNDISSQMDHNRYEEIKRIERSCSEVAQLYVTLTNHIDAQEHTIITISEHLDDTNDKYTPPSLPFAAFRLVVVGHMLIEVVTIDWLRPNVN